MNAIIFVLIGIGLINTIYLSSHVISKKPVKCYFFPPEWCTKVQFSNYSRTFGIPNPFAGLAMFILLFVFMLLYVNGLFAFWPVTVVVLIGFLFSMYFTYIQGFVLKAYCTWCVLSAIEFVLLFLIIAFR
ncbi:MAG: vitamin K epoxide reductase family protein [Acidobacteriaceae bacterium]